MMSSDTYQMILKAVRKSSILFLIIVALSAYSAPMKLKRIRLDTPQVVFVCIGGSEQRYEWIYPVDFPKNVSNKANGRSYYGTAIKNRTLLFSLTQNDKDEKHPGNLILSFDIICNSEVYKVNEISWNQEDDKVIFYGDNWMVKLTRYKDVIE